MLAALLPMLSMGQSSLGKTDDLGRIAIAAIVPDEAEIPAGAQKNATKQAHAGGYSQWFGCS